MSDIDWTLLARYAAGDCTDAERRQVEEWLAESPEHEMELRAIRGVAAQADWSLDDVTRARLLARVRARIAAAETPARRPLRRIAAGLRVAAAAAAVVAGSVVGYRALHHSAPAATPAAPQTIATARGQRLALRLPDGTSVVLAPASRLQVEAGFGERARVVRLEGQAAFTVTHDETKPFAVVTAHGVARDLGTRFVVRAYPEDTSSDVVVAEGLVAVAPASLPGDSVLLTPDHRARVAAHGRPTTSRVVAEQYFAWTQGELRFQQMRLDEAVPEVARWYDIDLRLATPALGARRLTASFRTEPASEVVGLIASALDLAVERAGSRYILRTK
jgi:transmembrane sensor